MNAIAYAGNGTNARSVTTGFRPDFVWVKNRSSAFDNILGNSMILTSGEPTLLSSNSTSAEFANGYIGNTSQWTSTSFTVNSDPRTNASGSNYIAWAWLGGNTNGSGVTNNSGTITSTVSANPTAGFSIVTYTGNGTAGATIGHGLGVAPSMIIVKQRNNTLAHDWQVYHSSLGATKAVQLNQTSASGTSAVYWNNTEPTSTVFSVGTGGSVNESGKNQLAYCFAAVSGYSSMGSFTGNGSADGPFIFTNFRPRWVMFKNASSSPTNWFIFDTSRDTYNVAYQRLFPSTSDQEYTNANTLDFLSNGFKIRDSSAAWNGSGNTIIYAAFAESPFKISRAR
jgi:hypothetical protein